MFGRSRHLNALEARRYRRVQVVVGTLLIALMLVLGFYLGQRAAFSGMGLNRDTYRSIEAELPRTTEKIAELEGELDVQSTRHEVDRQALEMVRSEIASQKEKIANLEEGLRFYRGLMAPGEGAQGLSLRPLELVALEEPGRYRFRIVAQQEALKHTLLKGQLYAEVVGVQEQEQVSYPLAELSEDIEEGTTTLRFRYFQAIEGELNLPPGFEPRSVSLVASARAPRKMEVRESYHWQVQERFTHVGK